MHSPAVPVPLGRNVISNPTHGLTSVATTCRPVGTESHWKDGIAYGIPFLRRIVQSVTKHPTAKANTHH